jgi:hypothetical protein
VTPTAVHGAEAGEARPAGSATTMRTGADDRRPPPPGSPGVVGADRRDDSIVRGRRCVRPSTSARGDVRHAARHDRPGPAIGGPTPSTVPASTVFDAPPTSRVTSRAAIEAESLLTLVLVLVVVWLALELVGEVFELFVGLLDLFPTVIGLLIVALIGL